jgi:hypothetical protein
MRYTLQDYSNVLFSGFNYKLPDDISSTIERLTKELGVSTSDKVDEPEVYENRLRRTDLGLKRSRPYDQRFKNKNDDSWKSPVPFKATKIEKKEGVEKQTNDIRVCLNKISNKNYEQQRDAIFELIDDESNDIVQKEVAQSIFDTASSNKFYSELYAGLYKDLIEKFSIFSVFIVNLIDEYYDSMDAITNIDSDEDYNLYCENNKTNDKRKATSTFIVNLMVKGVIDKLDVLNLVVRMQEKVISMVDLDNKTYEVDEITENLFILITLVASHLSGDFGDNFIKIRDNIETCSKYKTKDHKSISSRAIFKYMDMLDKIK